MTLIRRGPSGLIQELDEGNVLRFETFADLEAFDATNLPEGTVARVDEVGMASTIGTRNTNFVLTHLPPVGASISQSVSLRQVVVGAGASDHWFANPSSYNLSLVGGTISTSSVALAFGTNGSQISLLPIVTRNTTGGTPGFLELDFDIPNNQFTVDSSEGTDTSNITVMFRPLLNP